MSQTSTAAAAADPPMMRVIPHVRYSQTSAQFCPHCHNLMKYTIGAANAEAWVCQVCTFSCPVENFEVTLPETRPDADDYYFYPDDPTLKRIHSTCPACKRRSEMVVFYGKERSMVNNYVCTSCHALLGHDSSDAADGVADAELEE